MQKKKKKKSIWRLLTHCGIDIGQIISWKIVLLNLLLVKMAQNKSHGDSFHSDCYDLNILIFILLNFGVFGDIALFTFFWVGVIVPCSPLIVQCAMWVLSFPFWQNCGTATFWPHYVSIDFQPCSFLCVCNKQTK